MTDTSLIISDPPHHHVVDQEAAASYFGMPVVSVRMKTNYPIPEIWFAETDLKRLESTAAHLAESGLSIILTPAERVAAIPVARPVSSFEFTETALVAQVGDEEVSVAYDLPLLAVFCQPVPHQAAKGSRALRDVIGSRTSGFLAMQEQAPRVSDAMRDMEHEHSPFLDLYVPQNGVPLRLSVVQTDVDYAGLRMTWRRASDNMLLFVAECQDHFKQAKFDRRLVGMRMRKTLTVTEQTATPHHRRSGFSYATTTLVNLMDSISDDLHDISQPELSSRLVYLTHVEQPRS